MSRRPRNFHCRPVAYGSHIAGAEGVSSVELDTSVSEGGRLRIWPPRFAFRPMILPLGATRLSSFSATELAMRGRLSVQEFTQKEIESMTLRTALIAEPVLGIGAISGLECFGVGSND